MNRSDHQIRRAVGDLLDLAPPAPESVGELRPFAPVSARRRAPVLVGALAIAAVGVAGVVLATRPDDRGVADVPPAQTAPPTAPSGPAITSALPERADASGSRSQAWQRSVGLVIADHPGWGPLATEVTDAEGEPFGAAVVAMVDDTGRIVFDVRSFGPSEHSDDPAWQRDEAGATDAGVATAEGTLFTVDVSSTRVRRAVIVSPDGVVTVHAEGIAASNLPVFDVFSATARHLARLLPSATTPCRPSDPRP